MLVLTDTDYDATLLTAGGFIQTQYLYGKTRQASSQRKGQRIVTSCLSLYAKC